MFTRNCAWVVTIAGASTAAAQELVTYSLTWSEVFAGTNQPVPSPNGSLGAGEGVRLAMRVTYSPPFGSPATYTPPPPPGTGTIAGLGSIFVDILGMNLLGGTWSDITRNAAMNPGGVPGGFNWSLGGGGDPQPGGNIFNIQAGQFVLPGNTAVSTNPIDNIWRATWTPSSYTVRTMTFQVAASMAASGQHSSLLIKYGNEPGTGNPQYVGKFVSGAFGSVTVQIPAPGTLALFAGALLVYRRPRRCQYFSTE